MRIFLLLFIAAFHFSFGQNITDKEGRKQGEWKKYWDDSKTALQYQGAFVNDKPVGQFWYYYPSSEVRAIIEHISENQSFVTYYFKNREVMSEGMYLHQKRDSIWINYNNAGLTLSMENFKNGKLEGKKVTFYIQNQIENGEIKVLSESFYKDSLKSGPYVERFSTGKIKLSGHYKLDQPLGVWRKYNTKGELVQLFRYKNGVKNGWVLNYNENQEVIHRDLYKNGELLSGEVKVKYLENCKSKGIDPND
jgi:antitoxin component YwqK of YwqJK toxin-antitoxin module